MSTQTLFFISIAIMAAVAIFCIAIYVRLTGPKKYVRPCRRCSRPMKDRGWCIKHVGYGYCRKCATIVRREAGWL